MFKLDSKVHELLGRGAPKRNGLAFGIELELEGFLPEEDDEFDPYRGLDLGFWDLVDDPSLRQGGIEFVSGILDLVNLGDALDEIQEVIDSRDLQATPRCGVHVHINTQYMTFEELFSVLVLYVLLEPTIFQSWCAGRESNHFCVPLYSDTRLIERIRDTRSLMQMGVVQANNCALVNHGGKYGAIGVSRLRDLGTLEFRAFPGSHDMMQVRDWVQFIARLVAAALAFDNCREILAAYKQNGLDVLLRIVNTPGAPIEQLDQEDAEYAALEMVGYRVPHYDELDWTMEE